MPNEMCRCGTSKHHPDMGLFDESDRNVFTMNKALAAWCLIFTGISAGHAENRLFPTDILRAGEADMIAQVAYDTHTASIRFRQNTGKQSLDLLTEHLQARYGLGSGWHVGAGVDYYPHYVARINYLNPPANFINSNSEGWQNPTLWAKYGFLEGNTSPLSLSLDVSVSPHVTGAPTC